MRVDQGLDRDDLSSFIIAQPFYIIKFETFRTTLYDYPYSPHMYPHPTVIDIDQFSLGAQAGTFLLKRIKDPTMLIQTYTALPRLIQRDATRLHTLAP